MAFTYDELLTTVASFNERSTAQLEPVFPQLVQFAENAINLSLKELSTQEVVRTTFETSNPLLVKPARWRETVSFVLRKVSGGVTTQHRLQPRTVEFVRDFWPEQSETDVPRYYCDLDLDYLLVAPTPDQAYEFEMVIQASVDPLTSSNQVNYISKQHPALLMSAVQEQVCRWLRNDARADIFKNQFMELVAAARVEEERRALNRSIMGTTSGSPANEGG